MAPAIFYLLSGCQFGQLLKFHARFFQAFSPKREFQLFNSNLLFSFAKTFPSRSCEEIKLGMQTKMNGKFDGLIRIT
jgi:hypothetical protein